MKKLIQILITFGLVVVMGGSASGEEIVLHCTNSDDTRNYTIDKNGKYLNTHEGAKHNRNDGSILDLPEKDLKHVKELDWWVFGESRKEDSGYSCAEIVNHNNLSLTAFCFQKGKKWQNFFEKRQRFCIPFTNPFK